MLKKRKVAHLDIDGTRYIGKLGDEQMGWLQQEVEMAGCPLPRGAGTL